MKLENGKDVRLMKELIKTLILAVIMAVLVVYAFISAVVQESFRNCPPTAAELAEDASLERYLP